MIRRPPRSTLDRSSAASDVYKRQAQERAAPGGAQVAAEEEPEEPEARRTLPGSGRSPVSYTHLRAHETVLDLVCRLLLEKKQKTTTKPHVQLSHVIQAQNSRDRVHERHLEITHT